MEEGYRGRLEVKKKKKCTKKRTLNRKSEKIKQGHGG
jgi:hypothetical protein